MRNLTAILAIAGLFAINTACAGGSDSDKDDTSGAGDSDEETDEGGDLLIAQMNLTCSGTTWNASADTQEWAQSADIFLIDGSQTNPNLNWDEVHTLNSDGTTENPDTSAWSRSLSQTGEFSKAKDGTSLFNCADHDGVITYAVKIYNQQGNEADCAIFGPDAQQIIDGDYDPNDDSPITIGNESFSNCIEF